MHGRSCQIGVEGEYQRAINRMARSTLGAFRSTPQGTLAAESGLTPARALLDHRQASFAQRLYARPRDGQGRGEILSREGAPLTARLRAESGSKPRYHRDPGAEQGAILPRPNGVSERGPAAQTARNWGHRNNRETIWADGSRLDNGKVGAACTWLVSEGWTGRRYHLDNKEASGPETWAILSALRIFGHR